MNESTSLLSDKLWRIKGIQLFDCTMADSRTLRRLRASTNIKFEIFLLAGIVQLLLTPPRVRISGSLPFDGLSQINNSMCCWRKKRNRRICPYELIWTISKFLLRLIHSLEQSPWELL
jgi:hypothetical protein